MLLLILNVACGTYTELVAKNVDFGLPKEKKEKEKEKGRNKKKKKSHKNDKRSGISTVRDELSGLVDLIVYFVF